MVGFLAGFERAANATGVIRLHIAAANNYRVWVNGTFFAYGPARAAHGFARVDEWDLTPAFKAGTNRLAIEVYAAHINAFSVLDEPGFLQAEVCVDGEGEPRLWTAPGRNDFSARLLEHRVQRAPRFSFQRTFVELYAAGSDADAWRVGEAAVVGLACVLAPERKLLPRRMPYPDFPVTDARMVDGGTAKTGQTPKGFDSRFITTKIGPKLRGYPRVEWALDPLAEWETRSFVASGETSARVGAEDFRDLDLGRVLSGFLKIGLTCKERAVVLVAWDEVRGETGEIEATRVDCLNLARWELAPGDHALETFEPYTARWVRVIVLSGAVELRGVSMRGYESPARLARLPCDAELAEIARAALATFRQNTTDVFMDCPSRERAGWLADSYYIARAAQTLGHPLAAETAFLENFLLAPERLNGLPEGMLPMCYPSDHDDGVFIPQWTLWLVLQLGDYAERGGERWLIEAFEPRLRALFAWFGRHRNAEGLLEKLTGWNFVEWSKANALTHDVNFPTNWLYAAALDVMARLYRDGESAARAKTVRETTTRLSWRGEFFADRALRSADGTLVVTDEFTEICQYSAFIFGAVSRGSHAALWRTLVEELGPGRAAGVRVEVHPANMLFGWVMRWELLKANGERARMEAEMKRLIGHMARKTGTLWEHDSTKASCCHGFASYAWWLLAR